MKRLLPLLALIAGLAARADTQKLEAGQIIRGAFTQERHLQGFINPARSDGHFILAAGRGLLWEAEKPFPITTVITPNGLAQSVGGKPTAKLDAQKLPILAKMYGAMSGALGGDWQALDGQFSVRREGETITLLPKQGDGTAMALKRITLTVTRFVDRVEIEKPGGDVDILTFSGQTLSSGPLSPEETAALAP